MKKINTEVTQIETTDGQDIEFYSASLRCDGGIGGGRYNADLTVDTGEGMRPGPLMDLARGELSASGLRVVAVDGARYELNNITRMPGTKLVQGLYKIRVGELVEVEAEAKPADVE